MTTNLLPDTSSSRSRPRRAGGPPPTRRRSLVVATLAALLGALSLLALAPPAPAAAEDPEPTTTTLAEGQDEGIIPEPNSGRAPEDSGDRGGALQLAVFAFVLVGVGGGVAMVVRESRRARARGLASSYSSDLR